MSGYNNYSRDSYGSRHSSGQYGNSYGDSSRSYNEYNDDYRDDYRDEGRYADNRRLINNNGDGCSSQNNYNNRYDDLIDSRRNTDHYSNDLDDRQDPYSRMGGYNDNHDGEYRSSRKNTDSRNPFSDPIDRYDSGRANSSYYDTERDLYNSRSASYANKGTKSSYKNTDNHPDNCYRDSLRNRSPDDNFEYGSRYRDGGRSFDEVNAGYGYKMKDDDAGLRYKPENEDRYVGDGGVGGKESWGEALLLLRALGSTEGKRGWLSE